MPQTVTVNGEVIRDADIRAEAAALRARWERGGEPLPFEQRLRLRDGAIGLLVERALMSQEARRLNLAPTPREIEERAGTLVPRADGVAGCRAGADTAEVASEAERLIVFERLIANWSANVKRPSPGEVRAYYRSHREEFQRPEMVRASHLVKHDEGADRDVNRAVLEKLRERLLAGEDFARLAAAESDCPERGGDLGSFARGVMVEAFDAVVFRAPLHQPTGIFETVFGLHIALVHERSAAGVVDLIEAAPRIEEALLRVKHDREVGLRLEALRQRADIRGIA